MYAMLLTTPGFLLTFVIFLVIGFSYANQNLNVNEIIEIKAALASHYNLALYNTVTAGVAYGNEHQESAG